MSVLCKYDEKNIDNGNEACMYVRGALQKE